MPLFADRVKETTTTSGTGTYSLAGAVQGFQGFVAGIGTGNTCYYSITDGTDWEVGIGTVTDAGPDTLSRDTILASSNSGSAVSWGSTSKNIWVTIPAQGVNFCGASARDGIQAITNATFTALTHGTEDFDTNAFHSISTETSKYTIPAGKSGKYLVTAYTEWAGVDATILLYIRVNGSTYKQKVGFGALAASGDLGLSTTAVISMNDGDYVEAVVWHNKGSNTNVNASNLTLVRQLG